MFGPRSFWDSFPKAPAPFAFVQLQFLGGKVRAVTKQLWTLSGLQYSSSVKSWSHGEWPCNYHQRGREPTNYRPVLLSKHKYVQAHSSELLYSLGPHRHFDACSPFPFNCVRSLLPRLFFRNGWFYKSTRCCGVRDNDFSKWCLSRGRICFAKKWKPPPSEKNYRIIYNFLLPIIKNRR